jgi:hypothetical protein
MAAGRNTDKLREEFEKCASQPEYFISKYVKVVHTRRGLVPFDLYGFQKDILVHLQNHRFNIIRKFRQAGITTIAAAYALHHVIFNKHKTVTILSIGDKESTLVLSRIMTMYDELPKFLRPKCVERNKHEIKLSTGSNIVSKPSGKASGRSISASLLIIDEAAFIENIENIWAASYPIISTGGSVFVISTVNGTGNWYHDMYIEAKSKRNDFNAIDINWRDHPEYCRHEGYEELYLEMERNNPPIYIDKWEATTRKNIGIRRWNQEYEAEFLGTGDTYIDGETLLNLVENENTSYSIKYNNRMRVWKEPEPYYEYLLAADTSLGRERDNSAFHVINLYTGEQVAEFYSNKTPINEFAKILVAEGTYYNTASVLVERNTIGNTLIERLFDELEYENIMLGPDNKFGIQITQKLRDGVLADLEEYLRINKLKINSARTTKELQTFIVTETGKAEADKGQHDDLVMSLAIACFGMRYLYDNGIIEHGADLKDREDNSHALFGKQTTSQHGISEENMAWLLN